MLFSKKNKTPVRQPHDTVDDYVYMFRRSRTLTGSLSDTVRAANEQKSDLRSDRLKHHDLHKRRRFLAFLLVLCLSFIGGLIILLKFYISDVQIISGVIPATEHAAYQKVIREYFASHPTERFRFSLRQDQLERALQREFPEIASLQLDLGGFFAPSDVELQLREPLVVWNIRDKIYYIDKYGVSFERLFGPTPSLIVVEDNTGIDPNDAGAVASERTIRYVGRLVALVQEGGLSVERVQLPVDTSRQIDLLIEGRGYVIKTSLDRDPAGQALDVKNAVAYFDNTNTTPQYVDVRVSSKAYYR